MSRSWKYLLVAVLAFLVGSAAVTAIVNAHGGDTGQIHFSEYEGVIRPVSVQLSSLRPSQNPLARVVSMRQGYEWGTYSTAW